MQGCTTQIDAVHSVVLSNKGGKCCVRDCIFCVTVFWGVTVCHCVKISRRLDSTVVQIGSQVIQEE